MTKAQMDDTYRRALMRAVVRKDGRRYIQCKGYMVDQFGVRHVVKKDQPFAVFVWNLYHPDKPCQNGFQVHHVDENKLNDRPDNHACITNRQHSRIHMLGNKINNGRKFSPMHKQKIREANIGKKMSEAHKKKIGETVSKLRQEAGPSWFKKQRKK